MSKYKAMIIYSSITGNTEKIANAFAETFKEYNIEPKLLKLEGNYLGEQILDYSHHDYDFLVLGSPVIASIPYHDFYIQYGAQDDYGRRSFGGMQGPGSHDGLPGAEGGPGTGDHRNDPAGSGGPGMPGPGGPGPGGGAPGMSPFGPGGAGKQHRIAFCTYGGVGQGPTEAAATLELIKELFQGQNFVGFFACPGAIRWNDASEKISKELKINKFRAQELIARYIADPISAYFKDYTPSQLALFDEAAEQDVSESFSFPTMTDNDPIGIGKPGSHFWSYDLQNRPNERDIFMAQAFLKDIIEDYYLSDSGEPRTPSSVYYSIN